MTSKLAPLHSRRNGHDSAYLLIQSSGVLYSYPHRRMYHGRRRGMLLTFVRTWLLPAATLLFATFCFICIYWLGAAIDRAVRSLP